MAPKPRETKVDFEEIGAIVQNASEDPVETNAHIRDTYFALAGKLGDVLHGGVQPPENATFANFAAWSAESLRVEVDRSNANGQSLRPGRWLYGLAAEHMLRDDTAIALNIVHGQGEIFREIASAVLQLLDTIAPAPEQQAQGRQKADELWADYEAAMKRRSEEIAKERSALETMATMEEADLGRLLHAMRPYHTVVRLGLQRARSEADRKQRAELILTANVRLVGYEQARLQPVLKRNLDFLPKAVRTAIGTRLFRRTTRLRRRLWREAEHLEKAAELLRDAYEIAATRHVFSMIIGGEEIVFGKDVPLPPAGNPVLRDQQPVVDQKRYVEGEFFPYLLQTLESLEAWTEWSRYDRSDGRGFATSVDNWLRYPERLNFIANVFRSRQMVSGLYEKPDITPNQLVSTPETPPPASANPCRVAYGPPAQIGAN